MHRVLELLVERALLVLVELARQRLDHQRARDLAGLVSAHAIGDREQDALVADVDRVVRILRDR